MSKKKKLRRQQRKLEKQNQLAQAKPKGGVNIYPILLVLITVGSFLLRVLPSWSQVFIGGEVHFREVDPYYQMRLVDYMVHNFPNFLRFDYYTMYLTSDQYLVNPQGPGVGFSPVLSFLVAFPSWIIGLGHPSQHLVETVGALVPPILAALNCIVVYFLGKALLGRRVGLIATLLVAVIPGEYLFRSLLGFTDHHILEVLLTSLVLLFVVMGLKRKKLWWALIAGLAFGTYQVAWHGGMLFIFVFWLWFMGQYFWNLRKSPDAFLCKFSLILFLLACLPMLFFYRNEALVLLKFKILVSIVAIGTPLLLLLLSRLPRKHIILVSGALVLVAGIIGIVFLRDYVVVQALNQLKSVFYGAGSSISEAQPTGLSTAFDYFGVSFILSFVGFYFLIKKNPNPIIIVWTIVLFVALLGQRRWCYYYVVPLSVLSALCIDTVVNTVKEKARLSILIVILCFTLLPSIHSIWGLANLKNQIDQGWYTSLTWLRDNSPNPFPSEDEYTARVQEYEPSYGVLAWWDFGHWITYISHRVPISNPAYQDTAAGSKFFASTTVEEARKALEGYNIRYIILSSDVLTGKWYAVIKKAGKNIPVENSVAYMLWQNTYPDYKLAYSTGDVRIYEKVTE